MTKPPLPISLRSPSPRKRREGRGNKFKINFDVAALRLAANKLPYQHENAADLIRKMRDSGY